MTDLSQSQDVFGSIFSIGYHSSSDFFYYRDTAQPRLYSQMCAVPIKGQSE